MREDSNELSADGLVTFAERRLMDMDESPRLRSARVVLRNLFGFSQPDSVLDVGTGDGAWLRAALELGAGVVLGVDRQDEQEDLPEGAFLRADVSAPGLDAAVAEGREPSRFDLVLALDVADRLAIARSAGFVDELCRLGDIVLFAAAIPLQDGHPNEQWAEFWALHFRRCGFRCFDLLRLEMWANPNVEWRLAQNLLVFVRQESAAFPLFPFEAMDGPLSLVHPAAWLDGRQADGDSELAALSRAWMAGESGIPSSRTLQIGVSGGRSLVLFTGGAGALGRPVHSVARLQEELAEVKARVREANLDLEMAAEGAAALRLDRSDAERTAREEFHLRMNMERDFLLADSQQKALAAANAVLREQAAASEDSRTRLPQIMSSLNRALERERAIASQTTGLRDALDTAQATIEQLTQERQALEQRVREFFAGSWRLSSPGRALQRILGRHDAD